MIYIYIYDTGIYIIFLMIYIYVCVWVGVTMYALVLLVHIAAYCGSSVQCSCLVWFLLPPIAYCSSSVQFFSLPVYVIQQILCFHLFSSPLPLKKKKKAVKGHKIDQNHYILCTEMFIRCVRNVCYNLLHILYKSIHDYFILLDTTLK